ncbi:MAG: peptidoglycan editing factor PgeF [Halanaerobium sp.]|nr:peptidoglycan editing factor PgeF [Halanaerobium sp.]
MGELVEKGSILVIVNPAWEEIEWLEHCFTTREGGISIGAYTSLNLGLHTDDNPENVRENRARLAGAFSFMPDAFVCAEQIHGNKVAVVTGKDRGRGAMQNEDALQETDGMVTDNASLPLLSFYADCVPVMVIDRNKRAIGIGHAGWKGTLERIGAELVAQFRRAFNSNPEELEAWIGPAIGACCYEVDDRVSKPFQKEFPFFASIYQPTEGERGYLDLKETNRRILLKAGLRETRVTVSKLCTSCQQELFFSYRRDGRCGRMGALLNIKRGG